MSAYSLKGQFLIAMPNLEDPNFQKTVVYLVGHGEDGAMGLIVNQSLADVSLADVIDDLELEMSSNSIVMPADLADEPILNGGPIDKDRGFVLHSIDYFRQDDSYAVNAEIGLTATKSILSALANGSGPQNSLLALGYCGWAPGQLEGEIQENSWLNVPHSSEILFDTPLEERYDRALASIGVTQASLSSTHGSA